MYLSHYFGKENDSLILCLKEKYVNFVLEVNTRSADARVKCVFPQSAILCGTNSTTKALEGKTSGGKG